MTDNQNAYSIRSWQLLANPTLRLIRRLNSGIVRFPCRALDLGRLDWYLSHPEFRFAPVWVEQTCWAVLATSVAARQLERDQVVIPVRGTAPGQKTVAAHFVSPVRGMLHDWRRLSVFGGAPVPLRSRASRRCRAWHLAIDEALRVARRWIDKTRRSLPLPR
jgi:hypothetical protein